MSRQDRKKKHLFRQRGTEEPKHFSSTSGLLKEDLPPLNRSSFHQQNERGGGGRGREREGSQGRRKREGSQRGSEGDGRGRGRSTRRGRGRDNGTERPFLYKDSTLPIPYQGSGQRKASGTTTCAQRHLEGKQGVMGRKASRIAHDYLPPRLTFQDLQELSKPEKTAADIVHVLGTDLKSFQHSLETSHQVRQRTDYVEVVLHILQKLCKATADPSIQAQACAILGEIMSVRCSSFHTLLGAYTRTIPIFPPLTISQKIDNLRIVFHSLLTHLPLSVHAVLPIDDLVKHSELHVVSCKLAQQLTELRELRDEITKETIGKPLDPQQEDQNGYYCEWDNSQYREQPILPTAEEIIDEPPKLRSSIIKGSYTDWEHYYDIQFRLLREDFVAPLRRGIYALSFGTKGRNHDVSVYHDVRILDPVFTRDGVCFCIHFDASHFKRSWEHSKRLIYGSLLCLSCDNFKEEILFATVVNRKPTELQKGLVQVKFGNVGKVVPHCHKTKFVMAESRAYFEAIRHILESLQRAEVCTMPFTHCLVSNRTDQVGCPQYLKEPPRTELGLFLKPKQLCLTKSNQKLNLQCLYPPDLASHCIPVDILNEHAWPEAEEVELDKSQLQALRMALTQEVAVIQGPPGTGKTYIGLKIVQTLLQNRRVWDHNRSSPILVMCYTNHALDQFLEGILDHPLHMDVDDFWEETPKVVRIGGRSQNERIQNCNIHKIRGCVPYDLIRARRKCDDEIKCLAKQISQNSLSLAQQKLIDEFLLGPSGWKHLKQVIHPSHFYQLFQVAKKKSHRPHVLEIWLGLWEESKMKKDLSNPPVVQCVSTKETPKDNSIEVNHKENAMADEVFCTKEVDEVEKIEKEELIHVVGEAEIAEQERVIDDELYRDVTQITNLAELTLRDDQYEVHYEEEEGYSSSLHMDQMMERGAVKEGRAYSEALVVKHLCRKGHKQRMAILTSIKQVDPLESHMEQEIEDITDLDLHLRWQLFGLWVKKYQEKGTNENNIQLRKYEQCCTRYQDIQMRIDRHALEKADVIGMTTTGAAKYQHILHLVKPKIVIVEEAAEVFESHIVSALTAGTQHLILIGDHKQLRPKPNEYDLAVKHHLDVSLFERLIVNGMPHATLLIQHRMRPQIARLVCPHIYQTLHNHETVQQYPNIKGFDHNMYFFDHDHQENEDHGLLSYANEYEATFVAALCKHILKQGYGASQITVLTAYVGQLLRIRREMPKKDFEGIRIVNVDNFQGEENDIIILSLVRSNPTEKVGFLKEENRVCVALSRAKWGFYCFGNFKMLRRNVPIWDAILSDVESQGCLGSAFALHCQVHSEVKFVVTQPHQFQELSPKGGCKFPCKTRLGCGHVCPQLCHVTDPDHSKYQCLKPCVKLCPEGHPCPLPCYKKCKDCVVKVTRVLPKCNHEVQISCSQSISDVCCYKPCERKCELGHQCELSCSSSCRCWVSVSKIIPRCRHEQSMPCCMDPSSFECKHPCLQLCPEGHACKKVCHVGKLCGECQVKVKKVVPTCMHQQVMPCYQNPSSFECKHLCLQLCPEHHACKKVCHVGKPCGECQVKVKKVVPTCMHQQVMPCYQNPSSFECRERCLQPCPEGHPCQRTCHVGKPCGECQVSVLKKMPSCGHEVRVACSSTDCTHSVSVTSNCGHDISVECRKRFHVQRQILAGRKLPCSMACQQPLVCGHKCTNKCSEICTKECTMLVPVTCPQGHTFKVQCFKVQDPKRHSCRKPCTRPLPCGHQCRNTCGEECTQECKETVTYQCSCGHAHSKACSASRTCQCTEECSVTLECGHKCSGKCKDCFTSRIHRPCIFDVQVNRVCGHVSTLTCIGMTDYCTRECLLRCPHNQCTHFCNQPCPVLDCQKECISSCPHFVCKEVCGEPCPRPPCRKPCTKVLRCGHHCPGLCGEPCDKSLCIICNRAKLKKEVRGLRGKSAKLDNVQLVRLHCGKVYTATHLEQSLKRKPEEDQRISPLMCPACNKPLPRSAHFCQLANSMLEDVAIIMGGMAHQPLHKDRIFEQGMEVLEQLSVDKRLHASYSRKGKKGQHHPTVSSAITKIRYSFNSPDTHCMLQLLLNIHEMCTFTSSDVQVCELRSQMVQLIMLTHGKASLQIITDIQSEFFRLSLTNLLKKFDSQSRFFLKLQGAKLVGSVQTALEAMEEDHLLRLSEGQYQDHLHCLQRAYREMMGYDLSIPLIHPVAIPPVTKGEWYKCAAAKHFYFKPAQYRNTSSCPKCKQANP